MEDYTKLSLVPPLLKARAKKYGIPEACFDQVAMFDRALLWQIDMTDEDADKVAPGSTLFKPAKAIDKDKTMAPRGVVVTAGLGALDFLWAHGAELGSIVKFVRLSPWRMPMVNKPGEPAIDMQVVRVGDQVACEDLVGMVKEGRAELVRSKSGVHQWRIDGELRPRVEPTASDDY